MNLMYTLVTTGKLRMINNNVHNSTFNQSSTFYLISIVSCIKPRWQRISQDEGKAIAVTWKFNENERLVDCAVHRNISNEVFAVMKGTRVTSFNDFTTMIYGSDISFLVKPFNSSIHFGNYQLHINTTNGLDVFHYDVGFQLALKTADDLKDGMRTPKQNKQLIKKNNYHFYLKPIPRNAFQEQIILKLILYESFHHIKQYIYNSYYD